MAEVNALADELASSAARNERVQAEIADIRMGLPKLPHGSVPVGSDETGNVEVRRWSPDGNGPRAFDGFTPRDHVDIGAALGIDFDTGAKLSGSRFTFLRGAAARLH